MDTYLAFKRRYAFLQKDFQNTMNVIKKKVTDNKDWQPSKELLDNMEILSHYLSIVSSKLVDIEECVIDGKTKKIQPITIYPNLLLLTPHVRPFLAFFGELL